jgi:hypothetical protein
VWILLLLIPATLGILMVTGMRIGENPILAFLFIVLICVGGVFYIRSKNRKTKNRKE